MRAARSLRSRLGQVVFAGLLGCSFAPAAWACGAHQLAVLPPHPSEAEPITLRITGVCPENAGPGRVQLVRNGQAIRIDAAAVLPGIPTPNVPYELLVSAGFLPAGHYRVEYYLELGFAPSPPAGQAPPTPVATLEFDVVAAPAVPSLDRAVLTLFAALLAFGGLWALRGVGTRADAL